jgi:putative ABC transport system permease protein
MARQPHSTGPGAEAKLNMTWFRLAMTGCSRRPVRSIVTAAGVAIAIAGVFSLIAFQRGYRRGLNKELNRLGAHILVVPKGCPYDAASMALHGADWPCHLKASYLSEVQNVRGIAAAAPVFMSAKYESPNRHAIYLGVDTNILSLKPGWRIQGAFPKSGQILVGSEIARRLGWAAGEEVELPALPAVRRTVSGILAPTQSADDSYITLPLEDAQHLFHHTNELTHILVRLDDPNRLDSVVAALRGCNAGMQMNVVPLAHLFRTIQSLMNSTRWFLASATLVALLAAGAGVSASLLIAVAERTREIGVLRALGASRPSIFGLFWLETVQICLTGALLGVVVSFWSMRWIETWLRTRLPFTPEGEIMAWEWPTVAACVVLAIILGSISAFLPAWRAASLPPILAIRESRA